MDEKTEEVHKTDVAVHMKAPAGKVDHRVCNHTRPTDRWLQNYPKWHQERIL